MIKRVAQLFAVCVFSMFVFAISSLTAWGQQTLGSINGTVTDTSNAVIANVQVQAKNLGTGLVVNAKTKNDGSFNIVDLPIGTYSVTVSKDGFKTEVHSDILVRGNLATTVNTTLQAGEVTSTVTVTGTPLMNQTDTTNGYTLGRELIQNTPLGTGSFTQLAVLAPGVNADPLAGAGTNAGLGNQDIFANGQRDTSNSFTFNAITANNMFNGQSSSSVGEGRYVLNTNEQFQAGGVIQTNTSIYDAIGEGLPTPPQETIEELQVNTSMYDASQGANSGAHVELTTMSGTNNFHGQAYEYHQTTGWNAAPFFFNAAGTDPTTGAPLLPRPDLHRNTFGGTLGGPVIHNKLFFFGSYQGVRVTDGFSGATEFANVPTGLTSDRSAATLAALANIPVTSIDNSALAIMQAKASNGQFIVPSANITNSNVVAVLGGNATEQGPPSTFNADQINANFDYDFGATDRLSEKYYFQRNPGTSEFAGSQVLGFPQTLNAGSQVFSLDNTTTLTPNTTWEQRLGFIRQIANATTAEDGLTGADTGINIFGTPNFPGIEIRNAGSGNFSALRIGPANNFANAGVFQNQFEGASNYTWIHGAHNVSFGFVFDYGQLNVINRENQVAELSFANFADFLEGCLGTKKNGCASSTSDGTFLDGETNRYFRSKQAGFYGQDSFKLRSNLTLDFGLRWDWDGPLYDKNGLLTNFNPSDYSFDLSTDTINNTGLVIAGNNKQFCGSSSTSCVNNSTLTGRQWLFEPRIGVAWSPSMLKNVVVRAGYGLYADRGEFFTEFSPSAGLGISGPFGVTTEEPFTVPFSAPCTGIQCLSNNPFGTTAPPPPPNNLNGVNAEIHNLSGLSGCPEPVTPTCVPTGTPLFAFLFGGYDPANTLPYSENWTLDVQWQPRNDLLFDIGYVGNHGQHEVIPVPFNQPGIATPTNPINNQIYSYGYQATDADGGFGALQTEQVQTTIGEFTGADGNTALRVPFVGYNPNSDFWEAEGVSNYNALQLNVTKRMSHGLQVNASYTFSHGLDEGSGLAEGLFYNGNNPLDPRSGYGSSAFDRTHVFTVSYLYQIPDLVKSTGWESKITNGWGVSGVTIAESGNPYSIYDFSGDVASQYFGAGDDFITNPLLTIINGDVHSVQLQGTKGVNPANPVINGADFGVNVNAPGTGGVPPCGPTTDEPANPTAACDFSETGFSANAPRNPFRGPFQMRFDFGVFKNFKINERFQLRYDAQFFNLFNHPSFDAPGNDFELDPDFCPNTQTSPAFGCGWLGASPAVGNSGPIGNGTVPTGEGFITNTLGSSRFISMALHLTF